MPKSPGTSTEPSVYTFEGKRVENEHCDKCESAQDVIAITRRTPTGRGIVVLLICARCMGKLLDIATGWNITAQIERWYSFAAAGSEMAELSHKSPARQKAGRNEGNAKARRQGETW